MTTSCGESWPSVIRSQIKTEKKNKRKKKVKGKKEKKENTWKTSSKNRLLFSNT